MDFEAYLLKIKFNKYLKKLKNKCKNKKIIIYGTGSLFQYINEKYDLSSCFNIIGVSDIKYNPLNEGEEFLGYKIIPKEKIVEYKPDIVLLGVKEYIRLIEYFKLNLFTNTKIKVYPLARLNIWQLIKEIWSN